MKKQLLLIKIIIYFLTTFSYSKSLPEKEIQSLFLSANKYFQDAINMTATQPEKAKELYYKSLMHFEKIVMDGKIENGKLYYNIGNIYFRINDIGNAILNYRKAEKYIPNDPNLQQNLKFARSRRMDQFEEMQKTKILKTIFFWHYDISSRIRIKIFIVSFILLWTLAIIKIFKHNSIINLGLFFSIIITSMFCISLTLEEISIKHNVPGVIIDKEVIARKGNSQTYSPSFKEPLHAGTEFILIEKRRDWCQIRLSDNRNCWVPQKTVGLIK